MKREGRGNVFKKFMEPLKMEKVGKAKCTGF